MKEEDIRQTYKLLGHEKETEIRLIDPEIDVSKKKHPVSLFVNSEDEFVEICKKHEGSYNIYVGINERKPKGTDGKDVITVSTIIIDIDPVRPQGLEKQASRDEEIQEAQKIVDQILHTCKTAAKYKIPSVAFSGNGFHLWMKIPKIQITDDNRDQVEKKIKHFQSLFQKKYNNNDVRIDQMGDLPRIIKIIGTKSIKGIPTQERPHRESYWVSINGEIDEEIKTEISSYNIENEEELIRNYIEPDKKTLQQIRQILSEKKYQQLFYGNIQGYISRSEAEMAIICKLIHSEVPKEQIFEIMKSCRIGRWNTSTLPYREKTYSNAVEFILEKKKEKELGQEDELSIKQLAWDTAQELLQQYHFLSQGDKEKSTVYIYEDGIYIPFGKQRIWKYLEQTLEVQATITVKNEVFDNIYSSTLIDVLPEMPAEVCCLENGILNVLTRDFEPHTPNKIFFQKMPIKYEPNKVCPEIEKFLKSILKEEDQKTIQKWIGYCLIRDYRYPSILMLHGTGANGKSTFLNLTRHFLGTKNVASIPMQQLEEDKFSLVLLKDKLANIFADLPKRSLQGTSKLKGLTGSDKFSADQKFKDFAELVNYAKFMYSCNELPNIPEDTQAVWRRLILIEFPNTFTKTQQDVLLLQKLTTSDELSGLLNYALIGLKQLLVDNGFESEVENTRQAYIRATDGIGSFVLDCLVKDEKNDVQKEQVYSEYVNYCEAMGYDVEFDNAFFRHLKTKISFIQTNPKIDGRQTRCLRGINFKICGLCRLFFTHCNVNGVCKNKSVFKNIVMPQKYPAYPAYTPPNISTGTPKHTQEESILNIIDYLTQQLQHIPAFKEIQQFTQQPIETLTNTLNKLKTEGQIYEPKPDHYEILK